MFRLLAFLVLAGLLLAACDETPEGDLVSETVAVPATPPPTPANPALLPTPSLPTSTPTPPPTSTPAATADPRRPVDWHTLELGEAAPLPEGVSLLVATGCYDCDAPVSGLDRVDADGRRTIFPAPEGAGQYVAGLPRMDPTGRHLYVAVCTAGYCGGIGVPRPPFEMTLYHSADHGDSWTVEEVDERAYVMHGVTGEGETLRFDFTEWPTTSFRFGTAEGGEVARPDEDSSPVLLPDDGLWWRSAHTLLDQDGRVVVDLRDTEYLPYGPQLSDISVRTAQEFVLAWRVSGVARYRLGVWRPGQSPEVFETERRLFSSVWWLDDDHLLAVTDYRDSDFEPGLAPDRGFQLVPTLIDLEAGTFHPIEEFLPGGVAEDGGRNTLVGIVRQ